MPALQKIDAEEVVTIPLSELRRRDEQIALLTFRLEQLERMMFGTKSERYVPADPGQSTLFDLPVAAAPATEQISYTRAKPGQKKHPVREAIAAHLPRIERVIEPEDLPEGARKIGEEITETLEYTPATIHVDKLVRPKYVVDEASTGSAIMVAPMPPMPFPAPSPERFGASETRAIWAHRWPLMCASRSSVTTCPFTGRSPNSSVPGWK